MNKTLVYHSKTTKTMKQTIEIEVPEGYELVKTATGFEVVEVEKQDKSVKMHGCIQVSGTTHAIAWVTDTYAPTGLSEKCIVLDDSYDWEYTIHNGRHVLIPTRK